MQAIHSNQQFKSRASVSAASDSAPFSIRSKQQNWTAKSSAQPANMGQSVGWDSSTIRDTKLRNTIANSFADGVIDRLDMLQIFSRAKDGGQVDRTEFRDLKAIVRSDSLGLSEAVKNLSQKVVLGSVANQQYQGQELGNLRANSTGSHLQKLVDKWLLGGDRPIASSSNGRSSYSYRNTSASLFQDGASYSDVRQGDLGNCYFLSSLAAAAVQSPQQLQSMFTDNGDGTYAVRFYKANGEADYVTVDRKLPVDRKGKSAFADSSNEAWVALAEKAYVQWRESGAGDSNSYNSYQNIEGGLPHVSTRQITNRRSNNNPWSSTVSEDVATAFASGAQMITVGSIEYPTSSYVAKTHAYTLLGYNAETRTFTLYNPWGKDGSASRDSTNDGKIELTWDELNGNFDYWSSTAP